MAETRNVVMIITHDTGRHLGAYGRGPATPALDRLAAEGVVFDNAFCTSPQCSPARASLFTGLYPAQHGLTGLAHRGFAMNAEARRRHLAATLSRAGYLTVLFGLQHETLNPLELGYQIYSQCGRRTCAEVGPAAASFLRNPPRQPFFAAIGVYETHLPFARDEAMRGTLRVPAWLPDNESIRADTHDLNCEVERVDDMVGRLLAAIDEGGLRDNTLVVFTTDHGIPLPGAKATLFDPGLEVGLIARGPGGLEGGRRIGGLVSHLDVAPTIYELLGIEPEWAMEGASLAPLVRGEADEVRDEIHAQLTFHASYDPMRAVRTRRWKYIRHFRPRPEWLPVHVDGSRSKDWFARNTDVFRRPRATEMLFDLEADPGERDNRAGAAGAADDLRDLRERMRRWMEATGDPLLTGAPAAPPGATINPISAYSYGGDVVPVEYELAQDLECERNP